MRERKTPIDRSMHDDDKKNRIASIVSFIHFLTDFRMTFSPTFSDQMK